MDIMRMGKNPNYLGSWDLEDLPNRELTLTIELIRDEEVVAAGQKENCTVCHWTDKTFKPMILNVTNKKTLCKLYRTKDTEKLKGKSVIIGIERVKAFGDVYEALRFRARMPQAKATTVYKCENCKGDITAQGNMDAEKVAKYTKAKYGRCLCVNCATADANKGANE